MFEIWAANCRSLIDRVVSKSRISRGINSIGQGHLSFLSRARCRQIIAKTDKSLEIPKISSISRLSSRSPFPLSSQYGPLHSSPVKDKVYKRKLIKSSFLLIKIKVKLTCVKLRAIPPLKIKHNMRLKIPEVLEKFLRFFDLMRPKSIVKTLNPLRRLKTIRQKIWISAMWTVFDSSRKATWFSSRSEKMISILLRSFGWIKQKLWLKVESSDLGSDAKVCKWEAAKIFAATLSLGLKWNPWNSPSRKYLLPLNLRYSFSRPKIPNISWPQKSNHSRSWLEMGSFFIKLFCFWFFKTQFHFFFW